MKKQLQSKDLKKRVQSMIEDIEDKNLNRIEEEEKLDRDIQRDKLQKENTAESSKKFLRFASESLKSLVG